MIKTKMLLSGAIKWWFRQAEKLPDGSAKIFEEDNNRLAEEIAKLEADNATLQRQFDEEEVESYRQMQGKRLLGERLAATGHLLRDFNDGYKKTKDRYADLQKTLNEMDNSGLLKEYRNQKAIKEAEEDESQGTPPKLEIDRAKEDFAKKDRGEDETGTD